MNAKFVPAGLLLVGAGCQPDAESMNVTDAATAIGIPSVDAPIEVRATPAIDGGSGWTDVGTDAVVIDAGATDAGAIDPSATDARVLDAGATDADKLPALGDPGPGPWVPVPPDQVSAVCHLDPRELANADAKLKVPWMIVRYGRLCHESPEVAAAQPTDVFSTTKTLGALVTGVVAYQTRQIPRTGAKTGPFSDEDRVDQWLDHFSYNAEAHVGHVLAMVAQSPSLAFGKKAMQYDAVGTVQINSLSDMLNTAIKQDSVRLGADLEQFTRKFVYAPLGMSQSTWNGGSPTKNFANSWSTAVHDMARVGLLMLHKGTWSGQRLLDAEWIYRMTHPSFEDANTGYGYLTWVNASSNYNYGAIQGEPVGLQQGAQIPGPCAPVSIYPTHPHGLSDSPDCHYAAPYTCDQTYDVGVWQAVGLHGQVIQGHPGLDIVITAREVTPTGLGPSAPRILWEAVRPAVVSGDSKFAGDDAAFCRAYGSNAYAPDAH